MEVKILYDSKRVSKEFSTGWGFSCLVDDRILFDTGEKPESLLANMSAMNVDFDRLEAVVISHDHWDHTGGLWEILKKKEGLKVFVCPNFYEEFKDKVKQSKATVVEVDGLTKIDDAIYSTGEIAGEYKGKYLAEQSLIVETENGVTVITGCSHPGILKIMERVKEELPEKPLYMVFGGFHLLNTDKKTIKGIVEEFRRSGVKKAGPTHCSGKKTEKIFRAEYKDDFLPLKVGMTITV